MLAFVTLLTTISADQAPLASAPLLTPPEARVAIVATGVSLLSASLGVTAGILIENAVFRSTGVPQLGWFSLVGSLAFMTTAALTHLVVPLVLPLADGGQGHGSVGAARERGLIYALIPLGIGTLGCVGMLAGAALENQNYGYGQGLLAAGIIAAAFSAIAHQVLEIIGATRGYVATWEPRRTVDL